jgi:hypothetical protein
MSAPLFVELLAIPVAAIAILAVLLLDAWLDKLGSGKDEH